MAFLLEFTQERRRNTVGIFSAEENAASFLERLPFIRKETSGEAVVYRVPFALLPELYVAEYNGRRYVFSRYSYSPEPEDGEIFAGIIEVCDFDEKPSRPGFAVGQTAVDAYIFPNSQVEEAIRDREALYTQAKEYYAKQGLLVKREGLGSQDGEYLLICDKDDPQKTEFAFHLDPETVAEWKKAGKANFFSNGVRS